MLAESPAISAEAGRNQLNSLPKTAIWASCLTPSAQLDVSQVFDDDTLLPLDPTDVDWSVISGPVISVLDSGLLNPSSTVQKVKGLIYADSGLIFAVSLHYILDDSWAGGQF